MTSPRPHNYKWQSWDLSPEPMPSTCTYFLCPFSLPMGRGQCICVCVLGHTRTEASSQAVCLPRVGVGVHKLRFPPPGAAPSRATLQLWNHASEPVCPTRESHLPVSGDAGGIRPVSQCCVGGASQVLISLPFLLQRGGRAVHWRRKPRWNVPPGPPSLSKPAWAPGSPVMLQRL